VEYQAVLAHLQDVQEITHPEGTVYEWGIFTGQDRTWRIVVAEIGMGGPTAASETERAISFFHAQIALFVGVAGGLKNVKLGDVVASTKVYTYEAGKAAKKFEVRPVVWPSSYALEQRARSVARKDEWLARLDNASPNLTPQVYIGALAAGEKVLGSTQSSLYTLLKANYGDSLAVEMEGHGFLAAVHANHTVHGLVIRGISDLIDDKPTADAVGWQEMAARHAAAFAFQVLATFTLPTSDSTSPPPAPPAVWNVPHSRNPHFTGRDELLEQLDQHFALTGQRDPVTTRRAALTQPRAIKGLGGIGKTQIAVEYAYRSRGHDRYVHTLWVNAASEETIMTSFVALAELLLATELLRLCAFLAPDMIPEELIRDGAAQWSPLLQQAVADLFAFNQMIAELLKFSLVKRWVETQTLSIHRLVQAVQRDTMEPKVQCQWAERVVRAVDEVFPDKPQDTATWPQCLRYLDQAQTCHTLIGQYILQFVEAANLLNRTGTYLTHHALYTIAEPLYQRALAIYKQQLGTQHSLTATGLNNLALLYQALGKYEQAEPLLQQALAIYEQQLGAEDPLAAASLHNLANLYIQQGKYGQAEPLYQRALVIREQQLGAEHLDTATSSNDLAALYYYQGKYEQAEPLYQRALAIREQQLGAEHLHTANSLHNLAALYQALGKYGQAEPLYQRALAICEQQLGTQHPLVATGLHNLAGFYRDQGKYEQAELLYQRALSIREQQLGTQHLHTATSLHNLALLYYYQGKYEQAEPLYQRALAICESILGRDHPGTHTVRKNYATLLQTMGRGVKQRGWKRILALLSRKEWSGK